MRPTIRNASRWHTAVIVALLLWADVCTMVMFMYAWPHMRTVTVLVVLYTINAGCPEETNVLFFPFNLFVLRPGVTFNASIHIRDVRSGTIFISTRSIFRMEDYNLLFSGLNVDIGDFPALKGVYGYASQGKVLAIMGPSGCGKTTLLNTLYGESKVKEGEVRLGGILLNRKLIHRISYVTQTDRFFSQLTLRETLQFYAKLKVPETLKPSDMGQKVESLVEVLELNSCLDTQFGHITQPKLSSGERKRASIACELLGDPRVLLLDEPTTGLDATVALKIMNILYQYARDFKATVVCVVHQPSSKMLYTFDDILLMHMGKTAYQGTVDDALQRLASVGLHCGAMQNPADFFLDILSQKDSSDMLARIQPQMAEVLKTSRMDDGKSGNNTLPKALWRVSFSRQYRILVERSFKQTRRWLLHPVQVTDFTLIVFIIACLFYQLPRSEEMMRSREGVLALLLINNGFRVLSSTMDIYPEQMEMLTKERFGRLYRLSPYFLATLTTDLLLHGTRSLLQMTIVYWMAGLWADAGTFLAFLLMYVLQSLAFQSIVILFVILFSRPAAGVLGNGVFQFFIMTSGFYKIHIRTWADWLKYISMFFYGYGWLAKLEIGGGPEIECRSSNVSKIPMCHNSEVTTFEGRFYVESIGLTLPVWVDILAVLAVFLLFRMCSYITLRYYRRPGITQR